MSEIIYRKIKKNDFNSIESIINESFGLYKYVNNDKVLNQILKMYLQSCLAESSFSQIAEKDGKVIGVIMGRAKSNYKYLFHFHNIIFTIYHYMITQFQSAKYKSNIDNYKKVQNSYHKLMTGKKNDFDGSLTLFAVTEECQGLGVGKALLSFLFEYLKSQNTRNIYLYTDSTCNYGFYDKHGFVCLDEENLNITRENKPSTIDVFLYGYTMSNYNLTVE